ncbi:MAG: succinate dehydrogenase assembly factor 2 [Zetaproteobacteria bacterium CG12_big_fil_rev_8_21_14_0_65_54_13]|nr:MAG: succinate dehydrogenase assembly factor 2 [Zetaproteobacteria bacterium CG12_big_fil_rev_8_21_14_0_65_54_13]PIX54881.1 MAG: succinate dehydrogenase assembly factor 2 [Zetaproteobacteria bacterium CG_4_10_14_3_um_filter_54_28]PJA30348.1 MAG: succinate dehydrogenase assembly factor 2 [Zetaproteobacteria bacterium CG_4_9_14_3_um_filter_54_145]
MQESELAIRRLRYRLNRQGMLELDAWLAGLLDADMDRAGVVDAIESLLACEPPDLQAMMHGESPLPEVLRPWLTCD